MSRFGTLSGAMLGMVALGCVGLAGCSASGPPVIEKAVLQNDITERLTEAGHTPQSVSCAEDLVGEVGRTTRCEVVLSETNAIEPIVTATKVDGATVNYELTPALSQAQLQNQVGMLMEQNQTRAETVSCVGGLEGVVGNETRCTVTGGGDTTENVVKVTEVDGLLLNFQIIPV